MISGSRLDTTYNARINNSNRCNPKLPVALARVCRCRRIRIQNASSTGKDSVINDLVGPLFGSLKNGIATTIDRVISEGDTVVVLQRGHSETHDGQAYNNDYAQVFTVQDGLITAVKEYMDTALVDAVFGPAQ